MTLTSLPPNETPPQLPYGFSLIELMIALALGLVIIGGVISVFISNQQTYRSNQALSEVQDGSRTAFELMARDIRNAGLTGCGNSVRVANVLNNSPTGVAAGYHPAVDWWANWNDAILGNDSGANDPGANNNQGLAGSSSIELIGAEGFTYTVAQHNATTAPPTITINVSANDPAPNFQAGDVLVACDPDHAAIFQATGYNGATNTIQYQTGTNLPGNCTTGLGFPTACGGTGSVYTFGKNSQLARLSAVDWYIGNNPAGGTSLYRYGLTTTAANTQASPSAQEIVRNVQSMTISYLESGKTGFETAALVANWANVTAVQITLTLQSTNQFAGTNAQPISRTLTTTVTLRNRVN